MTVQNDSSGTDKLMVRKLWLSKTVHHDKGVMCIDDTRRKDTGFLTIDFIVIAVTMYTVLKSGSGKKKF